MVEFNREELIFIHDALRTSARSAQKEINFSSKQKEYNRVIRLKRNLDKEKELWKKVLSLLGEEVSLEILQGITEELD